MTQEQRILDYLREFKSITPLEAMRDLGIMRLGARIFDLKGKGYPIIADKVAVKNRWGETTYVASYRMEGQ